MKSKVTFSNSLRFRLIVITLLAVIPPVLLGWYILKKQATNYLYEDAKQDLLRGGESFGKYVGEWQAKQFQTLKIIKKLPFIQSQDRELQQQVLQNISSLLPASGFDIVNINGQGIATTEKAVANYQDRKWFQAIKSGNEYGTQTLIGRVSKRPRQCFSTGLNNPETQQLNLVIALCIDLQLIADNLKVEIQSAAPESRGFVVSKEGILIADSSEENHIPLQERKNYPPVAAALQGTIGYFPFTDEKGIQIISQIVPIGNDWIAIIEKDEKTVFRNVTFFNLTSTILGILILGLITAVIWYISGHITRPILDLTTAAKKLSDGDLETRVEVNRDDEIGTLANTFNSMAKRLNELIATEVSEAIIRNEIEKGRQIQQDFLPESIPEIEGWEIAYFFRPAKEVSGDFYDAFTFSNGDLGFVVADVCDKGVGAAMFMGLFRSFIRLFSNQTDLETSTPAQVDPAILSKSNEQNQETDTLDKDTINRLQCIPITNNYIGTEHGRTVMFATTFFGILNPKTGIVSYINGGHEPVFVLSPEGEIKHTLKSTGPAVGIIPMSKFMIKQVQLEPGDILIGYTDGVLDARNPEKKLFGKERLQALLHQPVNSAAELMEFIKIDLFNHISTAPQFDDITMLAIRYQTLSNHESVGD
ncbi:MAG: SpoIIE family protein phosphatase [Planktothrix sp. GU0601_MAG3]|nr:MAG: SpoIIE family protein phosphatase [Planktothrix sp. GU0601_MAG3]